MDEIGLFPLGIVLLPTEQVPLHIFEPRYRELIGESLARDAPFGVVLGDDGEMCEVGTLARVVEVVERFPDGRLNIVVEGGARFRLLEITDGRSFSTARIETLADQDDPGDPADIRQALALFARLLELTSSPRDAPSGDEPELSYLIAAQFEFSVEIKQELLEEGSERVRLRRLCELLALAVEALERQREAARRAQTNGKVEPSR